MTPITTDDPRRPTGDDPQIARVYAAVAGTESDDAADGEPYPTVADAATAAGLSRIRTLDALAILVDAGTVRGVRRADGAVGFGPAGEQNDETERHNDDP